DRFEVILVDDGSTDGSLARLQAWAASHPGPVQVLHKENGGQSTARNLGLQHARGEWVSFPDPDDRLETNYLTEVDAFLRQHPETPMVGTARLMLDDGSGEVTDTHPLRAHFRGGNRLRVLEQWPSHFHGSAPAAFFPRAELRRLALTFDPQVRPNFEDGHFCCRYLLSQPSPAIGFVGTAHYHYRKRRDASSTLQTSLQDRRRYTDVLRHGYLYLLDEARGRRGSVPEWLQNYVLYELSWYFSSQDSHAGAVTAATGPVAAEFHALLAQIVTYLDPTVIAGFSLRAMRRTWYDILGHAYASAPWHSEAGLLRRLDEQQGLVRLTYSYTGERPRERFLSAGVEIEPRYLKSMAVEYHDRILLRERVVWLPARRPLRVQLDGRDLELSFEPRPLPRFSVGPATLQRELSAAARSRALEHHHDRRSRPDRLTLRLAASWPVRRRFRDAWVLMDRIHDADDSGERLFRYLRKKRPAINAWFVLEAGTPDWERLKAAGYRRLVAHGSLTWKLLMLNCQHLISSHADVPVMSPPAITRLARPSWRFTFLQHGVIKDNLSAWLNPKEIDLFVVSSQPEYASIAGDDTGYRYTSREVKLTGLPRFDRLRQIGLRVPEEDRDLILVTPTWRQWLLPPLQAGSQRRRVHPDFPDSDFARQWLAFLTSDELRALAEEQGLTVGFLPHPNLQAALGSMELPTHVRSFSFAGVDVQRLFARAAVLVTDYSSIAFNAAYIDRPVVYFQFDAER
ncbi:MAG: CDP-glycerol:glycerophosphate glycerophosphotransferase, partial [Actinomycetes bacterium]